MRYSILKFGRPMLFDIEDLEEAKKEETMPKREKILEVRGTRDKDTENFHRFAMKEKSGVKGTIYVPKELGLPDQILIHIKPKREVS